MLMMDLIGKKKNRIGKATNRHSTLDRCCAWDVLVRGVTAIPACEQGGCAISAAAQPTHIGITAGLHDSDQRNQNDDNDQHHLSIKALIAIANG